MSHWDEAASKRRDFRQSKSEDGSCMGKKSSVKKPKPFVVEYNQRPNTPRVDFFMKCDGEWHEYRYTSYYPTHSAAERAMRTFKHQFENRARRFKQEPRAEWRVRDTREEVTDAAKKDRDQLEEAPSPPVGVGAAE